MPRIEPATIAIDGVRFDVPRDAPMLEAIPGAELVVTISARKPEQAAALNALQQGRSLVRAVGVGVGGLEHRRTRVSMWLKHGARKR